MGTICLPLGNFSFGSDLPAMYRHCKANEDKDMTPLDFVTDHLLNLDGVFDKHANGDPQKPHTPPVLQHHPVQNMFTFQPYTGVSFKPLLVLKMRLVHSVTLYETGFYNKIFHPPLPGS